MEKTFEQLREYFTGERKEFSLPLRREGTLFQQRVWDSLEKIPYGATWSYEQLAKTADCEKGWQAVGQANGKNAHSIVIPCHRVVNKNGGLGGYGGGLHNKKILLALEKQYQEQ
ncbi:MAG: methylated-DNA--[protein]-cysteine S-methyltransferase [Clostridiales bacterium]|nr:methylated-DNA--[protein]-cysteine S-methyltransferase [Clostridiales bacterium]